MSTEQADAGANVLGQALEQICGVRLATSKQAMQPNNAKECQLMSHHRRPIAHCDRCRRFRYGKPVHFHTAAGQTLRRTWLCARCCRLIGVRPAPATAAQRPRVLALVRATSPAAAVVANPDGTITCIWVTHEAACLPSTEEE